MFNQSHTFSKCISVPHFQSFYLQNNVIVTLKSNKLWKLQGKKIGSHLCIFPQPVNEKRKRVNSVWNIKAVGLDYVH